MSDEAREALAAVKLGGIKKKLNEDSWSHHMEELMKMWGEKAAGLRFMHANAAGYWTGFSNNLTIISIFITTLASTASLVSTSIEGENKIEGKGSWEKEQSNKHDTELRLLETVCIQHEIDHLNGMTIHDRQMITTIVNEQKFGRNEIVMITDGKETKDLKWKKAKPLIDSGEWELYVGGPIT